MSLKVNLEDQMKQFWEIEEVPLDTSRSVEEEACDELYNKTTTRDQHGKYVVRLSFKEQYSPADLEASRKMAVAILLHMEKRFSKQPKLQII